MDGEEEEVQVNLADVKARVTKVHVDGLSRTKNDIVREQTKRIFGATNFTEIFMEAEAVKNTLESANIVNVQDIVIDTGVGQDDYEVIFNVKETRKLTGGVYTNVGTNEGSMEIKMALPNMLGRGEKVSLAYTCGTTNSAEHHLMFVKPLGASLLSKFSCSVYQTTSNLPWSGYRELNRGTYLDLNTTLGPTEHSIRWEGVWRNVIPDYRKASFPVREQAGHSVKSSVKHIMVRDTREDRILPSSGSLYQLCTEIAGLGGDAKFFKHDGEAQWNIPLPFGAVFQATAAGGYIWQTEEAFRDRPVGIADKFFLGGPLTLRGFNFKGVGPRYHENSLGADAFWQAGLHLYTPLPFGPGRGGLGDLFRSHCFVNLGNSVDKNQLTAIGRREFLEMQRRDLRLTYGLGIVLKLGGIARVELNYCIPKYFVKGDSVHEGFQFGIGINFL